MVQLTTQVAAGVQEQSTKGGRLRGRSRLRVCSALGATDTCGIMGYESSWVVTQWP